MDANEWLTEVEKRAEAATEGPWKIWGMQVMADPVGDSRVDDALPVANTMDPHRGLRTFNADFIAHARHDVPALVGALRAVLVLVDQMEAENIRRSLELGEIDPGNTSFSDGHQIGIHKGRIEATERIRAIAESLTDQK